MLLVKCLACDADNDPRATGGYCDRCGKRLPPVSSVLPKRDRSGMTTDGPESPIPMRSLVSEALYTAAVVQLVAGGLFLIIGPALFDKIPEAFLPTVMIFTVVPTVWIGLCGFIARRYPLPAVVASLACLFVLLGGSFFVNPTLAQGWLLVNGVVLGLLLWALWLTRKRSARN